MVILPILFMKITLKNIIHKCEIQFFDEEYVMFQVISQLFILFTIFKLLMNMIFHQVYFLNLIQNHRNFHHFHQIFHV